MTRLYLTLLIAPTAALTFMSMAQADMPSESAQQVSAPPSKFARKKPSAYEREVNPVTPPTDNPNETLPMTYSKEARIGMRPTISNASFTRGNINRDKSKVVKSVVGEDGTVHTYVMSFTPSADGQLKAVLEEKNPAKPDCVPCSIQLGEKNVSPDEAKNLRTSMINSFSILSFLTSKNSNEVQKTNAIANAIATTPATTTTSATVTSESELTQARKAAHLKAERCAAEETNEPPKFFTPFKDKKDKLSCIVRFFEKSDSLDGEAKRAFDKNQFELITFIKKEYALSLTSDENVDSEISERFQRVSRKEVEKLATADFDDVFSAMASSENIKIQALAVSIPAEANKVYVAAEAARYLKTKLNLASAIQQKNVEDIFKFSSELTELASQATENQDRLTDVFGDYKAAMRDRELRRFLPAGNDPQFASLLRNPGGFAHSASLDALDIEQRSNAFIAQLQATPNSQQNRGIINGSDPFDMTRINVTQMQQTQTSVTSANGVTVPYHRLNPDGTLALARDPNPTQYSNVPPQVNFLSTNMQNWQQNGSRGATGLYAANSIPQAPTKLFGARNVNGRNI
jgi:hypothetical protein